MSIQQAIKEQIIMLASFAGREMNEMLLNGYMQAVSDLDQLAVLAALQSWLKTSRGFPHPADIREKVMPEISPEDDAEDAANLIISAVGKCGYTNPDKAREMIGELGWITVTRMGGWKHLCEVLDNDNESIYRAQIRNLAGTMRRKAIRGELDHVPMLPTSSSDEVQKLITQTFAKKQEK
jgi:hypothetical protein